MRTSLFLMVACAALSASAKVAGPAAFAFQDCVMHACLVALAVIACARLRLAGSRVRARLRPVSLVTVAQRRDPPGSGASVELTWREGVNSNAYYFVDVVAARSPAPIRFAVDRTSRLGAPMVVARKVRGDSLTGILRIL